MTYGYSDDLRTKALSYYDTSGKSQSEVCDIFGVGLRTFAQWIKPRKAGDFRRRPQQKPKPTKINGAALAAYINAHPDAYFREIAVVFEVSDVGILKACRRLGITRKKTLLYSERDEVERATFNAVVAQIPAESIVWVDETGIEERLLRTHARSLRGARAVGDVSGKRVGRTTLIAGYGAGVLKAHMHFKGYTNTNVSIHGQKKCSLPN